MNTTVSNTSELIEQAADLIDIGLSLVPGCLDSRGEEVHWIAIQKFEASGQLLLSIDAGETESKQIDKAIETISLSLRRLTFLFMELQSFNYYPAELAYNDADNCIDENLRQSNADFVLQSISDWLDSYENKLRVRSTKLRTVARRLEREFEKGDPANSAKDLPELDKLNKSAREMLQACMRLNANSSPVTFSRIEDNLETSNTTNKISRKTLRALDLLVREGHGPETKWRVTERGVLVSERLQ